MSYSIELPILNSIGGPRSVSKSGFTLEKSCKSAIEDRPKQSIFLNTKSPLKAEVMSLFEECSDMDWDGYGARPISEQSVSSAILFINSIPTGVAMPELSASPDGGVTFEWAVNGGLLSICIYENTIVYAQLIDDSKQYGEMNFVGEIPDAVLGSLLKFFQK